MGKYRTTSEAINKSTIIAIILLILHSFQRKGLCNSDLRLKAQPLHTIISNNTFEVTNCDLKKNRNMANNIDKKRGSGEIVRG